MKPFTTEPYHDPMHNIVETITKPSGKRLTLIKCLKCGNVVRIGEEGETPWTDANELGGIRTKRWFCSKKCFYEFRLLNAGYFNGPHLLNPIALKPWVTRHLAHDITGLMPILEREVTGGASIHERVKDFKDKSPRDEIERRMRKK